MITQYKKIADWLVGVHCYSHCLELAAKDALEPHFKDVDDFLTELFYHFKNSPTQWSLVTSLAKKLNYGVYTQPKSCGTRFLPHTKLALAALRNNWVLYMLHFQDRNLQGSKDLAPKTASWLAKLMDFNFLAKCRVYEDVVNHLTKTAKIFQADSTSYSRSVADAFRAFRVMKVEQVSRTEEL